MGQSTGALGGGLRALTGGMFDFIRVRANPTYAFGGFGANIVTGPAQMRSRVAAGSRNGSRLAPCKNVN